MRRLVITAAALATVGPVLAECRRIKLIRCRHRRSPRSRA